MAMTELPDRLPARPAGDGEDLLSHVLRAVRLTGSMLFLVQARSPWVTQAPQTSHFAAALIPRSQHIVSYHVVTCGHCWGGLAGHPPQPMAAGDVLVIPQGDAYYLAASAQAPPDADVAAALSFFSRMAAGELPAVVREGGDGDEATEFLCGFLGCDRSPFNPVLCALPRVIHLRGAARPGGPLQHLVGHALDELRAQRAGGRDVLLRLSELMFVEVVRAHLGGAPADATGWLAGLRDPVVSRALALMHAEPARAWTLATLADGASSSRTTLAARFTRLLGQPPMQYLRAWRMQLAARLLAERGSKLRSIAEEVGYASEAAFSRAFKRHAGVSPDVWRADQADSGGM